MTTLVGATEKISIAVTDWDVRLRAQALLSDGVLEDRSEAVFDLEIQPADMDGLFEWNMDANSSNRWKFAESAASDLRILLKKQLADATPDSSNYARTTITPSLATHFLMSRTNLVLNGGMNDISLNGCNMIEEKILAVSKDLFNSPSAFMVFDAASRRMLSNDYYNLGRVALDYILDDSFTPTIATKILNHLISYRNVSENEDDTAPVTGVFIHGDELTFNVTAISSVSQYDIVPTGNRNLRDRTYKFRIVAVATGGVALLSSSGGSTTTTQGTATNVRSDIVKYNGQAVMGVDGTLTNGYNSVMVEETTLADHANYDAYVDPAVKDTIAAYSTTGTSVNGVKEF